MPNVLLFFASFIAYLFLIPLTLIVLFGALIILSPLLVLGLVFFILQLIVLFFVGIKNKG